MRSVKGFSLLRIRVVFHTSFIAYRIVGRMAKSLITSVLHCEMGCDELTGKIIHCRNSKYCIIGVSLSFDVG